MNKDFIIEKINQYEKLIVFGILFILILILRFNYDFMGKTDSLYKQQLDHSHYITMAKDMSSIFQYKVHAPFCYRILVPFIAWILPVDLEISFYIMNFLGVYLTGVVLYYVLKLYFNKILSFIGLIIYCSLNILEEIFYGIYLVDSMGTFFLIFCFYCILTSKKKWYCFILFLGVLTKEIVLFTIPVFFIYTLYFNNDNFLRITYNKEFLVRIMKLMIYITPTLIIFIILRIIINPAPGGWVNYLEIFPLIFEVRWITLMKKPFRYYFLVELWGLLTLLFCCFNTKEKFIYWLRVYGIFMCLVYFQIFIATKIDRLLFIGFYPIIYLSLSGLNNLIYKLNKD